MNAFVKTAALSCALMAATSSAPGQDVDPFADAPEDAKAHLPKLIRVQVEWIEMDHSTLTKLMRKHRSDSDDGDLRDECENLSRNGDAKVLETAMMICRPGQKSSTESIQEYIYPTEYEPAELPNQFELTEVDVENFEFATPPTPTAFETRNLGTTVEVEPQLGADGRVIDLRIAPEIVYLVENQVWMEWNSKRGKADLTMPNMYALRISTGVTMIDGQYLMVAAQSPKGEDGEVNRDRKLMVFLKCDVLTVGE